MNPRKDFCALILTHGRPDKVHTIRSLERAGYTGPWFLVIDDEDPTGDQYRETFGADKVIEFSKEEIAATFDEGDNFEDRRCIVYARNASFGIARELGFRYFIQLDDDYKHFEYRFDNELRYIPDPLIIRDLDRVWNLLVEFFRCSPHITSVAMAQGGDFIGGRNGNFTERVWAKRKAMNSFICDSERPFEFLGRLNEDVNAYTESQRAGALFLTMNQVALLQHQTQGTAGGMTEIYLAQGTYVKSFYTVMRCPSGVTVQVMPGSSSPRLHHRVDYGAVAPKILRESVKR